MTDQLQSTFKKSSTTYKQTQLPAADRARIRLVLAEHADATSVRISPLARLYSKASSVPSPYYSWIQKKHMPLFLSLLLASGLLGGGTSYAAEGSLPGDMLYPVKVHVNESVREALATSPAARATVEANIASERLNEAHQLAVAGNLSSTTAASLATEFSAHMSRANENMKALAESDPVTAAKVAALLETRVSSNKDLLDSFTNSSSGEEHASERAQVQNLVSSIAQHLESAHEAEVSNTGSVSSTSSHQESSEEHSFSAGVRSIFTASSTTAIKPSIKSSGDDDEEDDAPLGGIHKNTPSSVTASTTASSTLRVRGGEDDSDTEETHSRNR